MLEHQYSTIIEAFVVYRVTDIIVLLLVNVCECCAKKTQSVRGSLDLDLWIIWRPILCSSETGSIQDRLRGLMTLYRTSGKRMDCLLSVAFCSS